MDTDTTRPSWLTIVLGLVTVVTFFMAGSSVYPAVPMYFERMGMGYTSQGLSNNAAPPTVVQESPSTGGVEEGASMMRPDYNQGTVDVTDTREFLKIFYSAQMKTRDVGGLSRRVETTVKGYEGRIDNEQLAQKSAYLTFVVPQSKYDQFRDELEGLVGKRFLQISINSENKLGQKQSIEEQAASASSTLASYQSQRSALVKAHQGRLGELEAQIDRENAYLANLREQAPSAQRDADIKNVQAIILGYQSQIDSENSSYTTKLASLDANIKYAKDWQAAVAKNDQSFMNDIETVQGSVSITWVSLWDIAQLYLPGYWIPAIFALLTGLSYWRDRRRVSAIRV
jgi:hypothetical protein